MTTIVSLLSGELCGEKLAPFVVARVGRARINVSLLRSFSFRERVSIMSCDKVCNVWRIGLEVQFVWLSRCVSQ